MWWTHERLPGTVPIVPQNIIDLLIRSYAIVEVGGLSGSGPERGRRFEQLFYKICDRLGVHLTEKAGGRSVAGQRSSSGFAHEVDGATRSATAITHWELKHLSSRLEKNELLIFNGKALDYLYDAKPLFRRIPMLRFLVSGRNIRDDCRAFAVQWGITVVEPGRLVLPVIYEAVARGFGTTLTTLERDAVYSLAPWACRSLQDVVDDLAARCSGDGESRVSVPVARKAKEVIDMQEQIGMEVLDNIEESHPDWINELAQVVWNETGGW